MRRRIIGAALAVLAGAAGAQGAPQGAAEDWPGARPIVLVVPFGAGSGSRFTGRGRTGSPRRSWPGSGRDRRP